MNYRKNLGYVYPNKSDEHMIHVKHLRDTNFDEHYQYLEKGLWAKIKRGVLLVALYLVGYHAATLRYGLKIHGRKNLKKHKELLKNGAITVCNHVLMWDYICVLKAIRPRLQYHPGWATNFEGPNAFFIRWVGGIPIPANNLRAMVKFNKALEQVLESGTWLHFFPEGSAGRPSGAKSRLCQIFYGARMGYGCRCTRKCRQSFLPAGSPGYGLLPRDLVARTHGRPGPRSRRCAFSTL